MASPPAAWLALGAVLLLAVFAGCGDEKSSTTSESISKAEFIKRANALCERERAGVAGEMSSFLKRSEGSRPPGLLYAKLAQLILMPPVERQMDGVRLLDLPRGDEDLIDEMLFADQLAIDTVATTKRYPSIAAVEREFIEAGKQFRAYGLTACTNDPGPGGQPGNLTG